MYPMSVNLFEASVFDQYYRAVQASHNPAYRAWSGFSTVQTALTSVFKDSSRSIIALDFSSMDTTFTYRLSKLVAAVPLHFFKNASKMDVHSVIYGFHHISLLTPFGVYQGHHGASSGSKITNGFESETGNVFVKFLDEMHPE